MNHEKPESTIEGAQELLTPEKFSARLEQEITPDLASLGQAAETLEQVVQDQERRLRPETLNRVEALRQKLARLSHKVLAIGTLAGVLVTAACSPEIKPETPDTSRPEPSTPISAPVLPDSEAKPTVKSGVVMSDDETYFTHTDRETSRMLNYLSGKDTLSEPEVLELFKKEWVAKLADSTTSLSAITDQKELIDFVAKHSKHKSLTYTEEAIKENLLYEYNDFPRLFDPRPDVYKALWQLEKEVGSPRIRFTFPPETNRVGAFYPDSNLVILSINCLYNINKEDLPKDMKEDAKMGVLIEEYAHAKQHKEDPEDHARRLIMDNKRVRQRADSLHISYDSAQQYEYAIPGSVEHEAHHVIAPQLHKRFIELLQKNQTPSTP